MDNFRKEKLGIIKFLNELSQGIYPNWLRYHEGMCSNLASYMSKGSRTYLGFNDSRKLHSWAVYIDPFKWDKSSDSCSYPIPDPYDLMTAHCIFHSNVNKWEDTPYGDLRREYCGWYAGQLLIKLNEEERDVV